MAMTDLFPPQSLFLSPMEGVTDGFYRVAMDQLFPENSWDFMACDFLRLPSSGAYPIGQFVHHYGQRAYADTNLRSRTIFQILTCFHKNIASSAQDIHALGFPWLDLNLGCPSKAVNKHGGGAYLLTDLEEMQTIVRILRNSFPGRFTAKIRIGYHDDRDFLEILKILEGEGVEAITIHARTRMQMYQGVADWRYIAKAVEVCKVPIIGNGDIWFPSDIDRMFQETGCHSVMVARGAMKTPWLAYLYKRFKNNLKEIEQNPRFLLHMRKKFLFSYFDSLKSEYQTIPIPDHSLLKRFKGLSRFLFDDFPDGASIKGQILRAPTLAHFEQIVRAHSDETSLRMELMNGPRISE